MCVCVCVCVCIRVRAGEYTLCVNSSSSSCRTINTDISDPLSPHLPIVHCFRKTNTDADYADDIALLANAPPQAETLLHNLKRATAGIGFHVNAHETEYMCFNQTGDISTLNGNTLKQVDTFTYLAICFCFVLWHINHKGSFNAGLT